MEYGNFTLEELYEQANILCQKHWGVNYTGGIELVKQDWERRNGVFIYDHDTEERFIRMSAPRNSIRAKDEVLKSLLHELVHWRLHSQNLPARDDDKEFILEAIRVGASISLTKKAQEAFLKYSGTAAPAEPVPL